MVYSSVFNRTKEKQPKTKFKQTKVFPSGDCLVRKDIS